VFFKSVNNSQSYHKSLAQLCHQELVEKMQLFKRLCFTRQYNEVFNRWRQILYFCR